MASHCWITCKSQVPSVPFLSWSCLSLSPPAAPTSFPSFCSSKKNCFSALPTANSSLPQGLFIFPALETAASFSSQLKSDFPNLPSKTRPPPLLFILCHILVATLFVYLSLWLQCQLHVGTSQVCPVCPYVMEEGSPLPFHALKKKSSCKQCFRCILILICVC